MKMKKSEIFGSIVIGISGLLYVIYNLIRVIKGDASYGPQEFNWSHLGGLVASILILVALVYAIIEKKILAGLIVAGLKITLNYGNVFIHSIFRGAKVDFSLYTTIFYMLFFLVSIAIIVALVFTIPDTEFTKPELKVMGFLGPIIVFTFLMLFSTYSTALVSAGAEVVALLLAAVMTAEFLFIAVFAVVPFDMIQKLVNPGYGPNSGVTFWDVLYWVVGIALIAYGIYALVMHILHSKHESEEDSIESPSNEEQDQNILEEA